MVSGIVSSRQRQNGNETLFEVRMFSWNEVEICDDVVVSLILLSLEKLKDELQSPERIIEMLREKGKYTYEISKFKRK